MVKLLTFCLPVRKFDKSFLGRFFCLSTKWPYLLCDTCVSKTHSAITGTRQPVQFLYRYDNCWHFNRYISKTNSILGLSESIESLIYYILYLRAFKISCLAELSMKKILYIKKEPDPTSRTQKQNGKNYIHTVVTVHKRHVQSNE